MTPLTQAKMLRVLQDGRFERVGGNETIRTDVRVIAATNRDLAQMVAAGEFRDDLYYRLGIVTITLPPLRERAEDLPLLVDHFLKRFSPEMGKEVVPDRPGGPGGAPAPPLAREHPRAAERPEAGAACGRRGRSSSPTSCRPRSGARRNPRARLRPPSIGRTSSTIASAPGPQDLYAESLSVMERSLLTRVLRHTGGNQVQAAKLLGITRGSLRTKIRTLGITIERSVWSAGDQPGR